MSGSLDVEIRPMSKEGKAMAETENCHGCKWLDEVRNRPHGSGYCCHVQRSKAYNTMDCVMDCGHRAPEIRRPELVRCELYAAGDFATRYDKEEKS